MASASARPRSAWRSNQDTIIGWGNFGAPPHPPHLGSTLVFERPERSASVGIGDLVCVLERARSRDRRRQACCLGIHLCAPVCPGLADPVEYLPEGRHPVAGRIGEVGAGIEGLPAWGEEHRHRPTARARHRLDGVHVDRVDVRPLFAVHLDRDEPSFMRSRRSQRPRRTRAPSRGTNGMPHSRPIGRSAGLARAPANASSPQGNQSTGLWACWSRYGLVASARRFGTSPSFEPVSPSGRPARLPMHQWGMNVRRPSVGDGAGPRPDA